MQLFATVTATLSFSLRVPFSSARTAFLFVGGEVAGDGGDDLGEAADDGGDASHAPSS